jgi:hypothetical protein
MKGDGKSGASVGVGAMLKAKALKPRQVKCYCTYSDSDRRNPVYESAFARTRPYHQLKQVNIENLYLCKSTLQMDMEGRRPRHQRGGGQGEGCGGNVLVVM